MSEAGKNYYRNLYQTEDKDTLIERILDLEEKYNTCVSIGVDSQWISKYVELNANCYMLSGDLVKQNQELKDELRYKIGQIKELEEKLKEVSNANQ